MKKEKKLNLIGIILGIAIIITGIVFCFTPADSYSTSSVDSASFGGDFYTYQYKATKAAAGNSAVAANNLRELSEKTATYVGVGFIFAGLLVSLDYLKKYSLCAAEAQPVQEEELTAEPVAAETVETAEVNEENIE